MRRTSSLTNLVWPAVAVVALMLAQANAPAAEPAVAPADRAGGMLVRFGATRFRADRPIGDARFSADGKRVVACAGGKLHVWDARDGTPLRTIDTGLDVLEDPNAGCKSDGVEDRLAFALHPKDNRVACGGARGGKTILQLWDFNSGKLVAEKDGSSDALLALAWTPDGHRLLERVNVGWHLPTGWRLTIRDTTLAEVRSFKLPDEFGERHTVVLPLPAGRQAVLWQSSREPAVFDLGSGALVRTLPHKVVIGHEVSSDLGLSPDGKLLVVTDSGGISFLDLPSGKSLRRIPLSLRGHSQLPRPLFSPDGGTAFVWDLGPVAFDVATGKERWRGAFRTWYAETVWLCDVSPNGATLLVRHGHGLSLLDAATCVELDAAPMASRPTNLVWSPTGAMLFTREDDYERTWTAWDLNSGRRSYDLQPGEVNGRDWKMLPNLFFLAGGELAACVERPALGSDAGPKEFLAFDAASGRCLRRLGKPMPVLTFENTRPVALDPAGRIAVFVRFRSEYRLGLRGGIRWDVVKQADLGEWPLEGTQVRPIHHFAPYEVTVDLTWPVYGPGGRRAAPARIRCYSRSGDGKVVDLVGQAIFVEPDRIQGAFLLASGQDGEWVERWGITQYTPKAPFGYDLWDLRSRERVRVLELGKIDTVVLGPGGRFLLHAPWDNTFEVYEPFVLRKAVATVRAPCRPERFEFSPDGNRVAVSLADTTVAVWDARAWRTEVNRAVAGRVPGDLGPLWNELSANSTNGYRASRLLSESGDRAVALLREKFARRKDPNAAQVRKWVADLDAPEFASREKAEKALRDFPDLAEPVLRKAGTAETTPEARQRIGKLLRDVEAWNKAAELRETRAVQALEWMGTAASKALLTEWAGGDPAATLTREANRALGR